MLILPFSLSLFIALFQTAFLPQLRIMAFAPFRALVYQKKRFVPSLWLAVLSGCVIDLLTSELHFGLYALNYVCTTVLLYRRKRNFFADRSFSLALFTALISAVSSLLHIFLLIIFSTGLRMSAKFLFTDLLFMPFLDAFSAFLWFTCPMKFYKYVKQHRWNLILKS
jgi:hypothetical protein